MRAREDRETQKVQWAEEREGRIFLVLLKGHLVPKETEMLFPPDAGECVQHCERRTGQNDAL